MVRAVVVQRPNVPLVVVDIELPPPAAGEARVRHTAIGVNYIDVYHATGVYPLTAPGIPGVEAAGIVVDTGPGVTHLQRGDRVAYVWKQPGAYVEERNVPAARLLPLPRTVSDEAAAGALVKGLTAELLLRRAFRVDARHTVVVYAAAGGVGTMLCQWGRATGAKVIGVVSTEAKARTALHAGAHHVLVQAHDDVSQLPTRVRELAADGVDVVYDSVGKDTFQASINLLKPRGLLALYGQASGPVAPFDPMVLAQKGSLFLTRPSLFDYIADPGEYRSAANALFDAMERGLVTPTISASYALVEAQRAHDELTARRTTGSLVLVP